ncbi:hypothetical protein ACJJTC_019632 [Scirpophaga incertulas]
MSVELRSSKQEILLVGVVKHQITGSKLRSNQQVLAVLFYNIRKVNLSVNESANLTVLLYQDWRNLQKDANKSQHVFEQRRQEFITKTKKIFDSAHADALQLIKINEDKIFLQKQRVPGRPGNLAGVIIEILIILSGVLVKRHKISTF